MTNATTAVSLPISSSLPVEQSQPTHSEIRNQLQRMLSHTDFNASARNRRFLTYVIEETLQGRANRIKAYAIALAVFDRGDDFDPLTDPIVRIEASRLRRAIEHYYLTTGKDDPIWIDMPKGSYVPAFSYFHCGVPTFLAVADAIPSDDKYNDESPLLPRADQKRSQPAPRMRLATVISAMTLAGLIVLAGWFVVDRESRAKETAFFTAAAIPQAPSILVLPFENLSADGKYDIIAKGITYELISSLAQFEDFAVYGAKTSFTARDDSAPAADFLVSGSVLAVGDFLRVNTLLTERQSGRTLWAWNTQRDLSTSGILDITIDIGQYLVDIIAQPDGVILDTLRAGIENSPAEKLLSFECVMRFKINWRLIRSDDFEGIRQCLENTVKVDPTYAQGFSSLALLNIDAYRYGFGDQPRVRQHVSDAMQLAQHARELDPRSASAYLALSLAYWFSDDVEKSLQIAQQGLTLNPNNTELMAELGLRYAIQAQWDRSQPLIKRAIAREPAALSNYRLATFLYAYMHGRYKEALDEALQIGSPYLLYGHVARAAAYGQLGEIDKASAAIGEILRIAPDYPSLIRDDLSGRHVAPEIIDQVIDGLTKAGFFS